ncbi:hypothetical protein MARHY1873 [Marinobacter nauticus ATCC 49840]|nr:hypothetical protein MARHY1873 [Marinobacter nauticus ATCC 49840]
MKISWRRCLTSGDQEQWDRSILQRLLPYVFPTRADQNRFGTVFRYPTANGLYLVGIIRTRPVSSGNASL